MKRPYVHPNDAIDDVVAREVATINRTLAQFGLDAGTPRDGSGALVSSTSYISYRIIPGPGQTIDKIEKRLPDITEAVSAARGRPTPVMLDYAPLALQVPHPKPKPLRWDVGKIRQLPPHQMVLGRSFSHAGGSKLEVATFDDSPHVLVAGTTGAGKSVMMQSMITSLCLNTPPDQLKIVMVDLKNEDMIPFANWPHVVRFAHTPEEAMECILQVMAEKARRIVNPDHKPYRLVLWIDELLQLAQDRDAVEMLGDLASIGRSKLINVVAATQSPTEAGGMGTLMKANFATRLVGQVAPGQSYAATQRKKLYADLLPGKGSFLRIEGAEATRFQSYYITHGDIGRAGKELGPRAAGHRFETRPDVEDTTGYDRISDEFQPDMTGYQADMTGYDSQLQPAIASYSQSNDQNTPNFPISVGRALTEAEAEALRRLVAAGEFDYRGEMSINRAMMYVYGSRSPERAQWIRDAIDGQEQSATTQPDPKVIKIGNWR